MFAKRVVTALDSPRLRREFAKNGLQTPRRFTEDEQAKKLGRIYEGLISTFKKRARVADIAR